MNPENEHANRAAASSNSNSMYFKGLDPHSGYAGDTNINFDRAGILYEHKDQYWVLYERIESPNNPVVQITGGWFNKSAVGGYFVREWTNRDPDVAGNWKVHSAAIQNVREEVDLATNADRRKLKDGEIDDLRFYMNITSHLLSITVQVGLETLYKEQNEEIQAEQAAQEVTDYEKYADGSNSDD